MSECKQSAKDKSIALLITQIALQEAELKHLNERIETLALSRISNESQSQNIALSQMQTPMSQNVAHNKFMQSAMQTYEDSINRPSTQRTVDLAIDAVFKLAQTEAKFRR